jgi:hypothetical protein
VDGKTVDAVSTLPWFPEGRGFSLGLDRGTIRKSADPQLRALHQWLIGHTDSGMLTRQEAVSMIPPCVLQVGARSKHRRANVVAKTKWQNKNLRAQKKPKACFI